MGARRRYDYTLQTPVPATVGERIIAIANREGISYAQVVRDMIGHGLDWREDAPRPALYAVRARTE